MPKKRVLTDEQKAKARERAKAWYWENRERSLAANQQWRTENAEQHRANASAYFLSNQEKIQRERAEERAQNSEKHFAYQREYRLRHIERIRAYRVAHRAERLVVQNNRRARATEAGTLPTNIVATLMTLQKCRCANCRADLRLTGRHLDHKQPLSKGGANTSENVELLCPSCNLKKSAKDPIEWAQVNGRLL